MHKTNDDAGTTAAPNITNENNNHPGIWIGIDLGTSNCTVAIWDTKGMRASFSNEVCI